MLEKIKGIQYKIGENGEIEEITIQFNEYKGNPNGNLNVTLTNADGELNLQSPKQLQEIAKQKVLDYLTGVAVEPEE